MPLLKKIVVRDLSFKYGTKQRRLITLEPIRRGETVYECDPVTCSYYPESDPRNKFTRSQVLELMEDHPEAYDFIRNYALMIDDDLLEVPRYIDTQILTDECAIFNHSCDPNCDYDSSNANWALVARRDINAGEELIIHYGCFETEDSLIAATNNEKKSFLFPHIQTLFKYEYLHYICELINKLSPLRLYLYGNKEFISNDWKNLMINHEIHIMKNEYIDDKIERLSPINLTILDKHLRFQSALHRAFKTFYQCQIEITAKIFYWYDRYIRE